MTAASLVVPVRADLSARLSNLRDLAACLGHVLRTGSRRRICQALCQIGRSISLRAYESPSVKPDIHAIHEAFPELLEAIHRRDFLAARDTVSEMLDLAGLY